MVLEEWQIAGLFMVIFLFGWCLNSLVEWQMTDFSCFFFPFFLVWQIASVYANAFVMAFLFLKNDRLQTSQWFSFFLWCLYILGEWEMADFSCFFLYFFRSGRRQFFMLPFWWRLFIFEEWQAFLVFFLFSGVADGRFLCYLFCDIFILWESGRLQATSYDFPFLMILIHFGGVTDGRLFLFLLIFRSGRLHPFYATSSMMPLYLWGVADCRLHNDFPF